MSCYWPRSPRPADNSASKCDASYSSNELHKVDFDQFRSLFLGLVPHTTGSHAPTLALRAFRVRCFYVIFSCQSVSRCEGW